MMFEMKLPGGESAIVVADSKEMAHELLKSAFAQVGYSEFCVVPGIDAVHHVSEIVPGKNEALVFQRVKL